MTANRIRRWLRGSAGLGFVMWVGAGLLANAMWWDLSLYEWLFLLAPLVIVPLAFGLLCQSSEVPRMVVGACLLQPFAAGVVFLSFAFPPGALAGALVLPWLLVCTLVALTGLAGLQKARPATASAFGSLAGMLYLPVGAAALGLSRAGIAPLHFSEPIVLLTAVHFHFTAFATPVFAAALDKTISSSQRLAAYRGPLAAAILTLIAATSLLAVGWLLDSPAWKLACVLLLVASVSVLAVLSLRLALTIRNVLSRLLLTISAASVLFGMVLAGLYGAGEFGGHSLIGLNEMARWHGTANGLGFSLCGLLGVNLLAEGGQ